MTPFLISGNDDFLSHKQEHRISYNTGNQYLKNDSHKTTMTVCISRQPLESQLPKRWKWSHVSIPKNVSNTSLLKHK